MHIQWQYNIRKKISITHGKYNKFINIEICNNFFSHNNKYFLNINFKLIARSIWLFNYKVSFVNSGYKIFTKNITWSFRIFAYLNSSLGTYVVKILNKNDCNSSVLYFPVMFSNDLIKSNTKIAIDLVLYSKTFQIEKKTVTKQALIVDLVLI